MLYLTTFALTSAERRLAASRLAGTASASGVVLALNLGSEMLLRREDVRAAVLELLPHCSLVFGNRGELEALLAGLGVGEEVTGATGGQAAAVASKLAPGGQVVVTDGPNPVTVASRDFWIQCEVPPVRVVDTNGAGDAFVGGFVGALLLETGARESSPGGQVATVPSRACEEASLRRYLDRGLQCAGLVVAAHGCVLPGKAAATAAQQHPQPRQLLMGSLS
jgi:sugar/nucleoside kinase (ribokinase family)